MFNKIRTPICVIMFAMNDVSIWGGGGNTFQNIHTLYEFTKCWSMDISRSLVLLILHKSQPENNIISFLFFFLSFTANFFTNCPGLWVSNQ